MTRAQAPAVDAGGGPADQSSWRGGAGRRGERSRTYTPREPSAGVLHRIVRTHLTTFLHTASAGDDAGLPRFVEKEFRDFLGCGALGRGFARFRCGDCAFQRLVPFSCKRRGVCPSCGGRRMTALAAHLVDEVFPLVPVRQWVLTLPYRLRYLLAWDHTLCRAVLGVYLRALLGFLRRQAKKQGAPMATAGRSPSSSASAVP